MSRAGTRVISPRSVGAVVGMASLVAGLAACDDSTGAGGATPVVVQATVEIGDLPEPLTGGQPPPPPPTTTPPATIPGTIPPDERLEGPIGEQVLGNRVIVIGDSLLASTAPRNDGLMCEALNGFGWDVEVDAEPGRFIEFGDGVLDQRLRPDGGDDWDAAAIMFGNQFDGDVDEFTRDLDGLLRRLAPRPTIIYTVTETDQARAALNEAIRDRPRFHPNLVVVDWAEITASEPEVLLVDDGPFPTEEGRGRLVLFTAAALGDAPGEGEGECLPSLFTDDSAIVL